MKTPRIIMAAAVAATALAFGGTNSASAQQATAFSTGFQVQNLSNATANVSISFIPTGTSTASASVTTTIAPNDFETYAVLPDAVAAGFSGGAVINSDQQVAAVVNIGAVEGGKVNFNYGASYSGFSQGSNTVSVPLLFKSSFGFDTFFNVQNTGDAVANVTVTYAGGEGAGALAAPVTETKTIQAGSADRFDQAAVTGLPAGFNGAATVTSDQPIAVAAVENGRGQLLSYSGFGSASTNPVMPLVNTNNFGFVTGIAMQNAGDAATDVTVSYAPSANGTACTETKTIQPKKTAFFALDAFAANPPAGVNDNCVNGEKFVGSGSVTSNSTNQPLVAVVNQVNTGTVKGEAYSSFAADAGSARIVLPIIQDRFFGYFTGFNVYNLSSAEASVTCSYANTSVTQTETIAANSAKTFIQGNAIAAGYNGSGSCVATGTGARIVGVLNQTNPSAKTDAFYVSEAINN